MRFLKILHRRNTQCYTDNNSKQWHCGGVLNHGLSHLLGVGDWE